MTGRRAGYAVLTVAVALALWPLPAPAQGSEVHGERDVFAAPGVVVAWAILRGATEATTPVVVRVAVAGDAYRYVAVDGVDPFSGARRTILPGTLVTGMLDVRSPRASFADSPRREIRLYPTETDWKRSVPSLTVYYLGVPDTTPEFASEAALAAYLADTVTRARR